MKHLAKTLPVAVAGFDETRDRLTERYQIVFDGSWTPSAAGLVN